MLLAACSMSSGTTMVIHVARGLQQFFDGF